MSVEAIVEEFKKLSPEERDRVRDLLWEMHESPQLIPMSREEADRLLAKADNSSRWYSEEEVLGMIDKLED